MLMELTKTEEKTKLKKWITRNRKYFGFKMKQIKYCILCRKEAKKSHHIIPQRELSNGMTTYLCENCHKTLHIAELRGLCRLPKSEEEYRKWKEEMKILSNEK